MFSMNKMYLVEEDIIMNAYLERVLAETKAKNANEPEFLQTVEEVLSSLETHQGFQRIGHSL